MNSAIRKLSAILVTLATALGVWAAPASSITGNFQRDFEHEYVGLLFVVDENGDFAARCSGSLLNAWTVLTAGHCVAPPAASAVFWAVQGVGTHYDPAIQLDPVTGYPQYCAAAVAGRCATSHTFYNYGYDESGDSPDIRDSGLMILDQPIVLDEYLTLAQAGSLDRLATQRGLQSQTFTLTGYGTSQEKPYIIFLRERLMATARLININSALNAGFNLQITSSPGHDQGGTCRGDSGGPILYGDTDIAVATDSFALNDYCMGTSFAYRLDQQAVLDWIVAHSQGDVAIAPLPR